LVELRPDTRLAYGFEQPDGAEPCYLARVLGHVEADADVTLRAEVVNLFGLNLPDERVERA
jgi:hypothetical protein